MIIVLLGMIMSATADPDYYAVVLPGEKLKIFTKISECTRAVYYHSAENRVLFQDGVLKIGTLKRNLDCQTLSSLVEVEYQNRTKEKKEELSIPNYWEEWIDIKETNKYGYDITVWIWIKGFNKSVEVTGLKLEGGTKDSSSRNKEDCLRKDRGKEYPGEDVVVAFHHVGRRGCFYDSVDQAELEDDDKSIILVHPAGKD